MEISHSVSVAHDMSNEHQGTKDNVIDPVVDGSFAPALPGTLLLNGGYDQDLRVLIGHNVNEGLSFTSPFVPTEETFVQNVVLVSFPNSNASNSADYITNTLYPPIFNGTYNYTSQILRGAEIVTEALFACNANYLARAFADNAYSYLFSVPPSLHGDDISYTFYQGPATAVKNESLALMMQKYITNFVAGGDPNGPGLPEFPTYYEDDTTEGTVLNLNISSIDTIPDELANERCFWWQKALY